MRVKCGLIYKYSKSVMGALDGWKFVGCYDFVKLLMLRTLKKM
jgi:hypothetical protein